MCAAITFAHKHEHTNMDWVHATDPNAFPPF